MIGLYIFLTRQPVLSRKVYERLALIRVLLRRLGLLGDVLEALVAKLTGPHVAAHNVLTGSVLDVQSSGGLDDADTLLRDHLDQFGAGLVRDPCVVASLKATLALLHRRERRLWLGGFFG